MRTAPLPLIVLLSLSLIGQGTFAQDARSADTPQPNAATSSAQEGGQEILSSTPSDSSDASETAADRHEADPFEPFNRVMFDVNDSMDRWVLEPVARGWNFVLPHPVQRGVGNFYDNLLFPIQFINNLLQGEFDPAAVCLTRFAVNTTIGLGGVFDPATALELPIQRADFGQTLGRWGTPPGPYLVWPFWGSSNVRDTVGLLVDSYLGVSTFFVDFPILLGSTAINAINSRALNLENVEGVRGASFDLYIAARDAYEQRRMEAVEGAEAARAARDEDLYFFDEEFDGEEEVL